MPEIMGYDLRQCACPKGLLTPNDAEYCGMETICMPKDVFDKAKFCMTCCGPRETWVMADKAKAEVRG